MTTTTSIESPLRTSHHGKYITFVLGNESYGILALKVREIIRLTQITAIPQVPGYIKGVINLRGKIIPVLDLRARFGLPETAATTRSCIIVVQIQGAGSGKLFLGLIVDAVEEVANITSSDLEPAPDFGAHVDTTFILGMAKIKGAVKTLLDIDQLLSDAAILAITRAKGAAAQKTTLQP
jgi:purine-binding chemotaxis protein CheW